MKIGRGTDPGLSPNREKLRIWPLFAIDSPNPPPTPGTARYDYP